MLWTPRPHALYERRVALGLTLEKLSELACLAVGSLRRIERGERVRVETLDSLAGALGVTREHLAQAPPPSAKTSTKKRRDDGAPAKAADAEPPPPRVPLRAEELSPRSRLAALIAREESAGVDAPLRVGGDDVAPLTVRAVRSIYTAFALRDGKRFFVRGKIIDQRGLAPAEANQLGTASGVGARFHVVRQIDAEATFGVTVHAVDRGITDALLDAHESVEVRLVVDVKVAPGGAPVFSSFSTANPHPWTLVAVAIVADAARVRRVAKRR